MNKATKALLLSLFILPGAGHFFLKKYRIGALLASISLIAVYHLMSVAISNALQITEQIQMGQLQPDVATITALITKQSAANAQSLDVAMMSIVICWVIGIVDSYRLGRKAIKESVN